MFDFLKAEWEKQKLAKKKRGAILAQASGFELFLYYGMLILPLLFLAWALSGCAPDPRSLAEAERTRLMTEQDAANAEAARTQQQAEFDLQQAEAQKVSAQRVESWNLIWKFVGVGAAFAVVGLGVGAGRGAYEGLKGLGEAAAKAAMNQAERVHMDPRTMSFPLIPVYEGGRRIALHNPNTGSVLMLDVRQPGDRQMIAGLIAQNMVIGVAEKARQHKTDPTGVTMVGTSPVLVGAKDPSGLVVGDFSSLAYVEEASDG